MEKEVRSTPGGVSSATLPERLGVGDDEAGGGAAGQGARAARAPATTTQMAPASRRSRSAWTWGRMIRPFGASASMGMTRTTRSPGETRSPTMRAPRGVGRGRRRRASRSSGMPVARRGDRLTAGHPAACETGREGRPAGPASALLRTMTTGRAGRGSRRGGLLERAPARPPRPRGGRGRSARDALRVFAIRCSPSAPSSSMPAVSTKRTGPRGRNSIGFSTGSVVVPGVAETMATSCRVRAFRTLDLPTLRRPKRPMWVAEAARGACSSFALLSSRRRGGHSSPARPFPAAFSRSGGSISASVRAMHASPSRPSPRRRSRSRYSWNVARAFGLQCSLMSPGLARSMKSAPVRPRR